MSNPPLHSSQERATGREDVVEAIRARIDIVDAIAEHVALKKSGANFKGLCPFHNERTPSFMVNPAKQMYYCFGCGGGGDIFSFVMKMEGVTFMDALHALGRRAGVEVVQQEKTSVAWREKEDLYKIHAFAAELYRRTLLTAPVAEPIREYVKLRKLSDETQDHFKIGYAPNAWDFFLEAALKEGFSQPLLLKSGLVVRREDGGLYDRFRHRLMFPIHDGQGRVVAFGGRIMDDGQPKYLNSPETPIYQKGQHLYGWPFARTAVAKEGSLIIVEGYMDVAILHQEGIHTAVATLGTALTSQHASMIKRYTDKCFLAFDDDAAGAQANARGAEALIQQGILVKVVRLPKGKDPDETVLEWGVAGWSQLMAASPTFIETLVPAETASLDQKLEVVKKVIPILVKVQNEIEKAEYVKWFANRIKTEERFVWKEMRNVQAQERKAEPVPASTGTAGQAVREPSSVEELQMLKLLVEDREFSSQVASRFQAAGWNHPLYQRLAQHCLDVLAAGKEVSLEHLREAGYESEDEIQVFSRLSFVEYPPIAEEKIRQDFLNVMETRALKNQLKALRQRIEEDRSNGQSIDPVMIQEFNQLQRKLKGSK